MLERQIKLARQGQKIGGDSMAEWAVNSSDWTQQNSQILRRAWRGHELIIERPFLAGSRRPGDKLLTGATDPKRT